MAEISKQALIVENNQSFPNNNTNFITPAKLRDFNTNMIDSNVNQSVYDSDSGSWNNSIDLINQFTQSLSQSVDLTYLNAFTASQELLNTTFATTGSNTFEGNQQVNGWVDATDYIATDNVLYTNAIEENLTNGGITFVAGGFGFAFNNDVDITGSISAYTMSADTLNVRVLHTTIESSSVIYSSGSNQFGDAANDVQTLYGSTRIVNELTASGLHYPTADGSTDQFLTTDGGGNLSFDWVKTLHQNIHNAETSSILRGTPLYISGSTGDNANVYFADASSTNRRPATLIAGDAILAPGETGTGLISGEIQGVDTSLYPEGTIVYLGVGGGWTATRPTGSANLVQSLGIITRTALNGRGIIFNQIGNNLPNIAEGYLWIGDSNAYPVAKTINQIGLATTGSNTFNGDQYVNGFVSASNGFYSGPNTTALNIGDGSNIRFWSGSTGGSDYYNIQLIPGVGDIAFSRSGASNTKVFTLAGVEGNYTTFQNNPVWIEDTVSSLTVNAQSTAISGSGSYSLQASTITESANSAQLTATSSVIGTFGITGQNGGDGKVIMLGQSGSLVLTNSGTTPTVSSLSHLISNQPNTNTNLIFKNSTAATETRISGSANIFANPTNPTSGFVRYVGGSSNIYTHGNSVPQISGSMGWSPSMNGNIISHTQTNAFTFRGPASITGAGLINQNILMGGQLNLGTDATNNAEKLALGLVVNNNAIFGGNINLVAAKTTLGATPNVVSNLLFGAGVTLNHHSSSAITYTSNIQNGGITVNNEYEPTAGSVTPAKIARVSLNTVYGHSHVLDFKGTNTSTTQTKHFYANILAGMYLSASVGTGDTANMLATGMIGNSLIFSGSSTAAAATAQYSPNDTQGSFIAGRFNALDGKRASSAETVFAVGTGTAANRKTGLLIDSGSNTYVEGSLNVSGSVTGNVSALSVTSNTASLDFNLGNFFTLALPSGTTTHLDATNIKAGQTINLLISQDSLATGSLTFAPEFKFSYYNAYSVTAETGSQDILTFLTYDASTVYAASVKKLQ